MQFTALSMILLADRNGDSWLEIVIPLVILGFWVLFNVLGSAMKKKEQERRFKEEKSEEESDFDFMPSASREQKETTSQFEQATPKESSRVIIVKRKGKEQGGRQTQTVTPQRPARQAPTARPVIRPPQVGRETAPPREARTQVRREMPRRPAIPKAPKMQRAPRPAQQRKPQRQQAPLQEIPTAAPMHAEQAKLVRKTEKMTQEINVNQARRGFIMAELLGPPLALRQGEGGSVFTSPYVSGR
jgi:hypothetical protein